MPRGDRTGPLGLGAMTGRGAGYCSGFDMPGFMNPIAGRGAGMYAGRGRGGWGRHFGGGGRGWRHMYYATGLPGWMRYGGYVPGYRESDPETEKQMLRNEARALQAELNYINKRLAEVEAGDETK